MSNEALNKLLHDNPALYKALMAQVACEKSLYKFTETMWEFVEPSNPFIPGWHMQAICEHLEKVMDGDITRLLINVPPGMAKSILLSVFFPAWCWIHRPSHRFLCTSYSSGLTERDNIRFRQVITSDLYRAMWGDKFGFSRDSFNITKMGNDKTGWKIATSTDGLGTGERADVVIIDDPHNVKDGESDAARKTTLQYFQEVLPTRLTNPKTSAMVVIMQRVHEEDVSGFIISKDLGYTHLMLPMRFDPDRKCTTYLPSNPGTPFFEDPRTERDELIFPARFPDWVVERDKKAMGPFAFASQMQQSPAPRGGGIIKRDYWKLWPPSGEEFDSSGDPLKKTEYPVMEYVLASTDTAYTSKQESDYNAIAILGVWRKEGLPKIMLMHCWQKRLDFRGETIPRLPNEDDKAYNIRKRKGWGMLEWTAHECKRFGVDKLLIEGKATGITLAQEIRKVYRDESWSTQLINPKGDKVARVYSIQHLFAEGMVYAPERDWAELAINEFEKFPKGKNDDLVDAVSQGALYLRQSGFALRRDEATVMENARNHHTGRQTALYDV